MKKSSEKSLFDLTGETALIIGGGGVLGGALAFCAGTFLCIAGGGLLPEMQFHTHDRIKLSLAMLAGVAIAVAVGWFAHGEPASREPEILQQNTDHSQP